MVFSSMEFLFGFFPVVLILYYNPIIKNRTYRNIVLLLASLGFYAWGEPVFVFLMILSIILTWFAGLKMDKAKNKKQKKLWLNIGVFIHVALLFVFKYLTFVASQLGLLLNKDFSAINITLPIGISFFTFQLMSYIFDVYYGKAAVQKNPFWLGLYVSLFPQLIAGPIVRYEQIADEIKNRKENATDFFEGLKRFIFGMGKKLLIANYVAQIADNLFTISANENITVLGAWLGAIAYTFQIYFDFSGYSDMAIGLGRMFGFHFAENFNFPYISKSITEFWRRWHISLSTWFRDYVYIPLGGNRVSKPRWLFNIFIVWLLTGIWHGANWTFLVWGLFYFVLLMFEKLTGITKKMGFFSHIYTLFMVIIGWVIFRAENIEKALLYISQMFGLNGAGLTDTLSLQYLNSSKIVLIFAVLFSTPIYSFAKKKFKKCSNVIDCIMILVIGALVIISTVSTTYNPFIYFNF